MNRRKPTFPASCRGFTLIELLVVIAIVAILAAILFPVFAQAKLSAKQSAGLSNEKQINVAALMYSNDSDGKFVPCVWYLDGDYNGLLDYTKPLHTWMHAVNPYVKSQDVWIDKGLPLVPGDLGEDYAAPRFRLVSTYIWPGWLPYMKWTWFDREKKAGFPVSSNEQSNAMLGIHLYIAYGDATPRDMNDVEMPADTAWLVHGGYVSKFDTPGCDPDFGDPAVITIPLHDGSDPRYEKEPFFEKMAPYRKGQNVGFVDGHAKWMNVKRLYYDASVQEADGTIIDGFMRGAW